MPGPLQEVVVITELKGRGLRGPESQLKGKRVIRKPITDVVVGYLELWNWLKNQVILVPGTLKKTIRRFLYLELHHVWSACLEPYAVEKLFATKYYWKSEYQSTIIVSNQNTVDNVLFSTYHCVLAKIRNLSGFLGDCCTHWNRLRWNFPSIKTFHLAWVGFEVDLILDDESTWVHKHILPVALRPWRETGGW